jgi:hypothetical protein
MRSSKDAVAFLIPVRGDAPVRARARVGPLPGLWLSVLPNCTCNRAREYAHFRPATFVLSRCPARFQSSRVNSIATLTIRRAPLATFIFHLCLAFLSIIIIIIDYRLLSSPLRIVSKRVRGQTPAGLKTPGQTRFRLTEV